MATDRQTTICPTCGEAPAATTPHAQVCSDGGHFHQTTGFNIVWTDAGPRHVFGSAIVRDAWAISVDDHCLRFHPQQSSNPAVAAEHVWLDAWNEVERLGGFRAVVEALETATIQGRPCNA